MWLVWCAVVVVAILFLAYKWSTAKNDYFEKLGIPHRKSTSFVGSMADLILHGKPMTHHVKEWYNEFPNDK